MLSWKPPHFLSFFCFIQYANLGGLLFKIPDVSYAIAVRVERIFQYSLPQYYRLTPVEEIEGRRSVW